MVNRLPSHLPTPRGRTQNIRKVVNWTLNKWINNRNLLPICWDLSASQVIDIIKHFKVNVDITLQDFLLRRWIDRKEITELKQSLENKEEKASLTRNYDSNWRPQIKPPEMSNDLWEAIKWGNLKWGKRELWGPKQNRKRIWGVWFWKK